MRRTQVYLTEEQRRSLDRLAKRERATLAEVIRRAVDEYVARHHRGRDLQEHLDRTLGALPDLEVPPRSEWDRGYG